MSLMPTTPSESLLAPLGLSLLMTSQVWARPLKLGVQEPSASPITVQQSHPPPPAL